MKAPVKVAEAPDFAPPHGGSFLRDPDTGAVTTLFVPDSGMDPDNGQPIAPETPAKEEQL